RLGHARHRLLAVPPRGGRAPCGLRRAGALGEAPLPDARAARAALPARAGLRRASPPARSRRDVPERPPGAALRLTHAALRQPRLRQLLQGAPAARVSWPGVRAEERRRRRPLEPARAARRPEPCVARADARARRRPCAR